MPFDIKKYLIENKMTRLSEQDEFTVDAPREWGHPRVKIGIEYGYKLYGFKLRDLEHIAQDTMTEPIETFKIEPENGWGWGDKEISCTLEAYDFIEKALDFIEDFWTEQEKQEWLDGLENKDLTQSDVSYFCDLIADEVDYYQFEDFIYFLYGKPGVEDYLETVHDEIQVIINGKMIPRNSPTFEAVDQAKHEYANTDNKSTDKICFTYQW